MKDSKELLMSNIKDLTEEEVQELEVWEYNTCCKCGDVDYSCELKWCGYAYWLKPDEDEYGNVKLDEAGQTVYTNDYQALCKPCFNKCLEAGKIEPVID